MKTSVELKQERASKMTAQSELVGVAKADKNRSLTADENVAFDAFQTEIERLDTEIERAVKFEANAARMSANGKTIGAPIIAVGEEKEERFSISQMIRNCSEGLPQRASESSLMDQANDELLANGKAIGSGKRIALPASMLYRAQTVTGDSGAKGGALVETSKQIIMPLLSNLTLEGLGAKVYSGLVGDVDLISGESFAFDYATENGTATDKTAGYAGPTLTAKRLTGVVKISNRLLAQTSPQAEANIYELIGQGINASMVRAAINGSTNGPEGLYDTAGNVQAGTAADPTWADVVGLETLIRSENATKENLYYLSDPALMGKLKTTKKDAGSGIYLVGENGLLNGKNYLDTTLAATLDAGASHPLIYGDFAQMAIGFWSGVQMTIDPYTLAAEGFTRVIFNIYNDVVLANPKAFAIRKNFTI
jgi:HK97 family phage major capsid protein